MSAHELAVGIHPDRHFLLVPVHYRVIALLAFASLLCDPKNLITPGFFLDCGLRRGWQVLHVYGSLLLRQRGTNEKSEGKRCLLRLIALLKFPVVTP